MNIALKRRSGGAMQDSVTMRLVKPRLRKERIPQNENSAECAALFGLMLAASNPAAATETFHRAAPKSTAPVAGTPGAGDLGGIIYVHDDDNYDDTTAIGPNSATTSGHIRSRTITGHIEQSRTITGLIAANTMATIRTIQKQPGQTRLEQSMAAALPGLALCQPAAPAPPCHRSQAQDAALL